VWERASARVRVLRVEKLGEGFEVSGLGFRVGELTRPLSHTLT